jgi:hypothetical protein
VRKTLTGSYKCGFYLGVEFKSPLDIVWQDGSASRMLLEVVRPVTTGLFYMWALSSLFEALSAWQTIVYAQQMCDLTRNECLLANGNGSFYTNGGTGDPGFYTPLWDPNHWHSPFGASISIPVAAFVTGDAYGYVRSTINNVTRMRISLIGPGHGTDNPLDYKEYAGFPNNTTESWDFHWSGQLGVGELGIRVDVTMDAPALAHLDIFVTRLTVRESPVPDNPSCIALGVKQPLQG